MSPTNLSNARKKYMLSRPNSCGGPVERPGFCDIGFQFPHRRSRALQHDRCIRNADEGYELGPEKADRSKISDRIIRGHDIFAFTGHLVFRVFGITLPAFQIAGGILLVLVALEMLRPGEMGASSHEGEDIAIVPLAFPLTSGPGSITTVILLVSRADNLSQTFVVPLAIFVGVLFTYLALTFSTGLFKRFGNQGLRVVTALMAIIVLAIAVQFILDGTAGAIKQFGTV
jgi:multiple antibiotic resistance protein